ncbi:unnamed protein product [Rotaria magnacalcarata]|uniref:Ketoreductase domain-containing protein n=1 Tax=Rotaria magnacalcarata TaxID=392030 RepID=A0A816YSB8_9BILA|nr:unnamed protein product [Rotaria magnacalcarata]CAF3720241.1 unnamed protein product [Rotaria magnacalcarata]
MSEITNAQTNTSNVPTTACNRFHYKTAIVTGAGSGIGRAVLLRLVDEGACVFGIDLNETGLKETIQSSSHPEQISIAVMSVTDEEKVIEKVNEYVTLRGHLDIIVNAAGILRTSSVVDTSLSDFRTVLDTNLIGTFLMCRTCLPHLVATKGNIINIASTAALHGHPFMSAYAASKGAIVAFTKALAREYLLQDVRANVVAPGGIDTPMNKNVPLPLNVNHRLFDNLRMPNGRFGKPEDVAGVVPMLASKDGCFINGDIIRVDGGVHS